MLMGGGLLCGLWETLQKQAFMWCEGVGPDQPTLSWRVTNPHLLAAILGGHSSEL